jgi:hypothetical protein
MFDTLLISSPHTYTAICLGHIALTHFSNNLHNAAMFSFSLAAELPGTA